jgi:hypothetical protein
MRRLRRVYYATHPARPRVSNIPPSILRESGKVSTGRTRSAFALIIHLCSTGRAAGDFDLLVSRSEQQLLGRRLVVSLTTRNKHIDTDSRTYIRTSHDINGITHARVVRAYVRVRAWCARRSVVGSTYVCMVHTVVRAYEHGKCKRLRTLNLVVRWLSGVYML